MRKDLPQDIKGDVEVIHHGAQRVASIINRLLTFSRQQKPERKYVDINQIIETTLALQAYELKTNNIKVTRRLADDLPQTMADPGQLQQVFLNLIINAATEMKLAHGKGKLQIKTEVVDNIIRISFKDDGPGIAQKNIKRIFDPFFTTREVGEGTGLGLSICYGIIAEHNGKIYVRSQSGKGATFIVELPIIPNEELLPLAEPAAKPAKPITGRILVVDDELSIRQLLRRILVSEGHQVDTVSSAATALNKLSSEEYDLILLDIKLPGMSGIEFYNHLKQIDSPLTERVIFVTGDIMSPDTKKFLTAVKASYIRKPFNIKQLNEAINPILSKSI